MFPRTGIEPVTFRLYDNPLQPNVISNYTIEGLIAKFSTLNAYIREAHLGTVIFPCRTINRARSEECGMVPNLKRMKESTSNRDYISSLPIKLKIRVSNSSKDSMLVKFYITGFRGWHCLPDQDMEEIYLIAGSKRHN